MSDLRLFLSTRGSATKTEITFGLHDLRDEVHTPLWKTVAGAFLADYFASRLAVVRIENAAGYDWYSSYLVEMGIDSMVCPGSKHLVQIYARPDHLKWKDLIPHLIDDEVWQIGGLLTFSVVRSDDNVDLVKQFERSYASIRPVADGQALEWTGPSEDVTSVTHLIRGLAANFGALLSVLPVL